MKQINQNLIIVLLSILISLQLSAQTGTLKGKVYDSKNNQNLSYANVQLQGTNVGAVSDSLGNYVISNIPVGSYNVLASYVGYKQKVDFEIAIAGPLTDPLDYTRYKIKEGSYKQPINILPNIGIIIEF